MGSEFSEKVKAENKRVVNGLLVEEEKVEFFLTGWNMDAIHARAATIGVGLFAPIAYAAGYLLSDNVERTTVHFTNKGIVALNCNKFLQAVSSSKVLYSEIYESILYTKNNTLKIVTPDDKNIVLELEDATLEKFRSLIEGKLNFIEEEKKYTSIASKAYNVALAGSFVTAGYVGARTFSDIFKKS